MVNSTDSFDGVSTKSHAFQSLVLMLDPSNHDLLYRRQNMKKDTFFSNYNAAHSRLKTYNPLDSSYAGKAQSRASDKNFSQYQHRRDSVLGPDLIKRTFGRFSQ